jgi:predicted AAA+ superfamily ATPase
MEKTIPYSAQHAKFYFFDTGVFNALRPSGPLDRVEEKRGQAIEGLVAQYLRAWIDYRHPAANLYYWRTSAGTEVAALRSHTPLSTLTAVFCNTGRTLACQ